ncbi:hypothetical protein [Nocardia harenae]|uniref:hypothetical protein n=1 Tax=Nocardia harenae TaxID=358707 RepID=UPI00083508F0|nr:hypothetical protein [Nocardia harenae]
MSTDASSEDGPGDILSPAEALDSDEVRNDDGDVVVDPPDDWSGANRFGMTAREEREGETLAQRLAEEEPDYGEPRDHTGDEVVAETEDEVEQLPADDADELFGKHHGQVDGVPEDGPSLFPVSE